MRSIWRIFQAVWIFFLFMGCTIVFYYGILWVSGEYNQYHRYDEPEGSSIKVFQTSLIDEKGQGTTVLHRLHLFFIEGE